MLRLDNVQTSDEYTQAATLENVWGSAGGFASVGGNDVYMQVQYSDRSQAVSWTDEVHISAGTPLSFAKGVEGCRFRSYTAGKPASISAALSYPEEPAIEISTAQVTVSAAGLVNIDHNGALVGTENTLDFEDSTQVVFDVVDTPGTKVSVSATLENVVTSWDGRSGAVAPEAGDYTAAEVTNAADKSSGVAQNFAAVVSAPNFEGDETLASADSGSVTPLVDKGLSQIFTRDSGTAAVTVQNPGDFPPAGSAYLVAITLRATSTGAISGVLWGSAYRFGSHTSNVSIASGDAYSWLFLMLGDLSRAVCVADSEGVFT